MGVYFEMIATLAIGASLAGCGAEELTGSGNYVCEEVARTIANVSWSCGTSLEEANRRGREFDDQYHCDGPTTELGEYKLEVGLKCPVSMAQVPCELANEAGDDFSKWIAAVPPCHDIVMPASGGTQ